MVPNRSPFCVSERKCTKCCSAILEVLLHIELHFRNIYMKNSPSSIIKWQCYLRHTGCLLVFNIMVIYFSECLEEKKNNKKRVQFLLYLFLCHQSRCIIVMCLSGGINVYKVLPLNSPHPLKSHNRI